MICSWTFLYIINNINNLIHYDNIYYIITGIIGIGLGCIISYTIIKRILIKKNEKLLKEKIEEAELIKKKEFYKQKKNSYN